MGLPLTVVIKVLMTVTFVIILSIVSYGVAQRTYEGTDGVIGWVDIILARLGFSVGEPKVIDFDIAVRGQDIVLTSTIRHKVGYIVTIDYQRSGDPSPLPGVQFNQGGSETIDHEETLSASNIPPNIGEITFIISHIKDGTTNKKQMARYTYRTFDFSLTDPANEYQNLVTYTRSQRTQTGFPDTDAVIRISSHLCSISLGLTHGQPCSTNPNIPLTELDYFAGRSTNFDIQYSENFVWHVNLIRAYCLGSAEYGITEGFCTEGIDDGLRGITHRRILLYNLDATPPPPPPPEPEPPTPLVVPTLSLGTGNSILYPPFVSSQHNTNPTNPYEGRFHWTYRQGGSSEGISTPIYSHGDNVPVYHFIQQISFQSSAQAILADYTWVPIFIPVSYHQNPGAYQLSSFFITILQLTGNPHTKNLRYVKQGETPTYLPEINPNLRYWQRTDAILQAVPEHLGPENDMLNRARFFVFQVLFIELSWEDTIIHLNPTTTRADLLAKAYAMTPRDSRFCTDDSTCGGGYCIPIYTIQSDQHSTIGWCMNHAKTGMHVSNADACESDDAARDSRNLLRCT